MRLGERIRRERKERGLLQEEASALLGVDQSTLSKWENGRLGVAAANFPMVAQFLDVPEPVVAQWAYTGEEPSTGGDDVAALRADVASLRTEVGDLAELVRQALQVAPRSSR